MKNQFKLFTALILCLSVFLNMTGVFCAASENSQVTASGESLNIPIIITERNGIPVKEFFFRRGVALEKGAYFNTDNMGLTYNGESITSSVEILQKYDDGSINWILVSGVIDLEANEEKSLFITDTPPLERTTDIDIQGSGKSSVYTINGPKLNIVIDTNGITSIKHNENEMLESPINQYVTIDGTMYLMNIDGFEVIKETSGYVKIKVSGKLCENVNGEMYITLAEQSEHIIIDHHITVAGKTGIESTGLKIGKNTTEYEAGEIIDSDYLTLGDLSLASFDNTRFNGATNDKSKTGFIITDDAVCFAPIVNGKIFTYEDGFSRTAQLHIALNNNAENMAKTLSLPPSVVIDCGQYVKAGEILTTSTGALVDSVIETFKEDWKKNIGSFYAGGIGTYNYRTKAGSINAAMPGEIEYNFAIAYMQTGDEEIFRKIYDMAILRSDVGIYRGNKQTCYGVMRARIMKTTAGTLFNQSHGYYSDEAGLYMAYLLSGDEYIYESLKLCIEKTLADLNSYTTVDGIHVPVSWFIKDEGETPSRAGFFESRGLIRARSLYLASRLFEDDRYKTAVNGLVRWAEKVQLPSGAFSQAVFHNGEYLYQSGQTQMPVKDYVMLMGFRGLSQILDYEDNEDILDLTIKVSDYLCSQGEAFGNILMHPNSDVNVYEVNEDNTRTSRTDTNIMAIDVLCTAFEKTGNEKYLKWILKFLDSYIASSVGGIGGGTREQGYIGSLGWTSDNLRVTSLLRTSDNLNMIFKNYSDDIKELGYEHLSVIFDDKCKYLGEVKNISVAYPAVISNVYENNGYKIVYVYNQFKKNTEESESWAQTVGLQFNSNSLYQGRENIVNSDGSVAVEEFLDKREYIVLTERPLNIEAIEGDAKLNIDRYEKDKIELSLSGEVKAEIKIKSGIFPIVDGEKYNAILSKTGSGLKLQVEKGTQITAQNGEITVEVSSMKYDDIQTYDFDGMDARPSEFLNGELKGDPVYPGQALYSVSSTNVLSSEITSGGIISYDFYIPNGFYSTDTAFYKTEALMEIPGVIKIFADAHGLLHYGSDATKDEFSTYGFDRWFTITLLIDADNKKVSVYMNGVCLVADAPFIGDASSVKTVTTALSEGVYIDNIYVVATDSGNTAKTALNSRFSSNYRYVETMDREHAFPASAKFSEELIRGGTSPYGEYRHYTLCQVTDSAGKSSQIWVSDEKMSSTISTYGEANVIELDKRTTLRIKSGSAVKKLKTPITSGIIKVGIDAYVDEKSAVSLLNLKSNGTSVLSIKLSDEANGETGIYKTTLNDDLCGGYILDKWINVSAIVNLNENTAELFVNGISGGVKSISDFSVDSLEITGIDNKIYLDNLTLEGFNSVDEARTSISIESLNDEITFSKVADFVQACRSISSNESQIAQKLTEAKEILSQNNYQKDKFGEIQQLWEENFDSYTGTAVTVTDGHAIVKRSKTEGTRYTKNLSNMNSGIFTTEFDFMMEKKADTTMFAQLNDTSGSAMVCYLATRNGNIVLRGKSEITLVDNYKEGKWYTISVRVNFDNKTCDVYINGTKKASNYPFTNNGSNVNRVFDTYKMESGDTYSECEYLLDNIRVYRDSDVPPIAVSSPKFSDADGNITWEPTSGGKLDSIYLRNEDNTNGDLYAAVFIGDELSNVVCIESVKEGINVLNLDLPVTDKKMTVKFFIFKNQTVIPLDEASSYQKENINLFVLSDSIYDGVSSYSGIGDMLQNYLLSENVTVYNYAVSGHQLANIAELGYLDRALDGIKKGDYVIISFAHNDSKASGNSYFAPVEIDMQAPYKYGTYQSLLLRYVQAIRLRGGNPIFATSLARYRTGEKIGKDHGNYIDAMKTLAEEIDVPLIDLNRYSVELLSGDNATAKTRYICGAVSGSTDSTHLTTDGADFFAKWIVGQMKELGLAIGGYTTGLDY